MRAPMRKRRRASLFRRTTPRPRAETAVQQGDAPAALIIPEGFGAHPMAFGPGQAADRNRPIRIAARQLRSGGGADGRPGCCEKMVMTSMPGTMAKMGMQYFERESGGLTPKQKQQMEQGLAALRKRQDQQNAGPEGSAAASRRRIRRDGRAGCARRGGREKTELHDFAFTPPAIGVMFLLFTASAAGRQPAGRSRKRRARPHPVARVNMTTLLAGKMAYCALLASAQLTLMFLWGGAVFHLDFFTHIPGFIVMTAVTSFAVASFGMLLASVSHTRAQRARCPR